MKKLVTAIGVSALVLTPVAVALRLAGYYRLEWRPDKKPPVAAHGGEHDEHGEHEEGRSHVRNGRIVLDAASVRATRITTDVARLDSMAVSFNVNGEVGLSEDSIAHVTPRIPGAIRAIHKRLGDRVRPGDELATIESVELGAARADHVAAHSEVVLAERNHGRWKDLFQQGLKTQNELWAAENELTRATIRHEAATGKLKALAIDDDEHIAALDSRTVNNLYVVRSPIEGTVLERHATLGENVEAKDVLFLVSDLAEVWVTGAVYERDLARVRAGLHARVTTLAFHEFAFPGEVTYVGQRVDEKTRTVPLRVSVKNAPVSGSGGLPALRPGMFGSIEIETARRDGILTIPASAVQTVNGESVVFVFLDEEPHDEKQKDDHDHDHGGKPEEKPAAVYEPRKVSLGERSGERVEVVRGLEAGARVAVENAYLLKSELEKSRISEGHAH